MIHSRTDHHRKHYHDRVCSVDPITLTGLALGALGAFGGAAAAGAFSGGGDAPTPAAPPTPAPAQQQPQAKPKPQNQPSFIGAAAAPVAGASGQKTLLGQ